MTTATRVAEETTEVAETVRVELVERVPRRPTGKGFGILVHEVLATAGLDAERARLDALARSLGRVLGNSEEEVEAATEAAERALAHPLLREAAAAAIVLRESPVVLKRGDGSLVEGVVDLAFRARSDAPWTVVDFKTDVRVDIKKEDYQRQVALYAEALSQASGADAEGVLLYV